MPKQKTQQQFLEEARQRHGDFYDYSLVDYINSGIKVTIICSNHGDFKITPSHHLRGVGCRKCFDDKVRKKQPNIIERFRQVHKDFYSYEKVIYQRTDWKVIITCPIHGDFEQTPSAHLSGCGCFKCSVENHCLSFSTFLKRAGEKHGNKYDYSQTNYINFKTKVKIICLLHGEFEQLPQNHLNGADCPQCSRIKATAQKHSFKYKGIAYSSLKEACQKLNKEYWVVLKRIEAGWTVEQAFDDEEHDPRHCLKINGVTYNGLEDAVKKLNAPVSSATVRRRLLAGMTIEQALFTPPKLGYDNGVVYVITNLIDKKQYVGLTTTSIEQRWERHLEQILTVNASLIHEAIAKFGENNFAIEELEFTKNIDELRTRERYWIQKLNTQAPNGYNITSGGEIGGSPGKPTRLPGDSTLYPSVKAAAEALAKRKEISVEAAEKRIYTGRIEAAKPHGMSKTRIYKYWDFLVHQKANPRSRDYNGSIVCSQWSNFTNFYEDMGQTYQEGKRLKLINPNYSYCKENCFWVEK